MTDTIIRGCTGKSAFRSMRRAQRQAKRMRRKYDEPLEAYFCKHCGQYHIGDPR